jgi:hypothetical protein
VLADGGYLVITLPVLSSVKRFNDWAQLRLRRKSEYVSARGRIVRRVDASRVEEHGAYRFIQYEYPRRAIHRVLNEAGFEVEASFPTLVNAGIGESFLLHRFMKGSTERSPATVRQQARWRSERLFRTRHALVREEVTGPLTTLLRWFGRRAFAHMELCVARKRFESSS